MELVLLLVAIAVAIGIIRFIMAVAAVETAIKAATAVSKEEKYLYVDIEQINDTFYMWDMTHTTFIAQGKNLDELKQVCQSRFAGYGVIVDAAQLDALGLNV